MSLAPEGIFSKIGQALGYDDIDFESHEFSRRYCVRSADRRFAYDFFSPRVIELILAHSPERLVVDGPRLAHVRTGRLRPETIPAWLDFAADLRERLPAYLFTT